jgi:hypothetical protein
LYYLYASNSPDFPLIYPRHGPKVKHRLSVVKNVFIGPLPSNGYMRTTWKTPLATWFCCCVRVFRALPRNGSTCHNIKMDLKRDRIGLYGLD